MRKKPRPKKPTIPIFSGWCRRPERYIYLTKKQNTMRGKRKVVYDLIRNGMTIRELQYTAVDKLDDTFWSRSVDVLMVALASGLVRLK